VCDFRQPEPSPHLVSSSLSAMRGVCGSPLAPPPLMRSQIATGRFPRRARRSRTFLSDRRRTMSFQSRSFHVVAKASCASVIIRSVTAIHGIYYCSHHLMPFVRHPCPFALTPTAPLDLVPQSYPASRRPRPKVVPISASTIWSRDVAQRLSAERALPDRSRPVAQQQV
jgi:hypothetical protein